MENEHIFTRALDKIKASHAEVADEWEVPWHGTLEQPEDHMVGVPYDNLIQVRPDVERLIRNHGIDLRINESIPGYSLVSDRIMLPRPSTFKNKSDWYHSLFHEMGHWTAHRTGRSRLTMRDHDSLAALEEVIAELTSAFMCEAYDVKGHQHVPYLSAYLVAMPHGSASFAMKEAVKATNYLLKKQ